MSNTKRDTVAPINEDVSTIVRTLLGNRGMKQKDLAARMGCNPSVITEAFRGHRRWNVEDLEKLSNIFRLPIAFFLQDPAELLRTPFEYEAPAEGQLKNRCYEEDAGQLVINYEVAMSDPPLFVIERPSEPPAHDLDRAA